MAAFFRRPFSLETVHFIDLKVEVGTVEISVLCLDTKVLPGGYRKDLDKLLIFAPDEFHGIEKLIITEIDRFEQRRQYIMKCLVLRQRRNSTGKTRDEKIS